MMQMLDSAARPNNPWRDNEDRVVQVFIYGSLAGGTGSGASLPFAYFIQDVIRDHGWGRPNIVGVFYLPSVFKTKVERALHDDIDANAYAALKEFEHAMRLGYEGKAESLSMCHDPDNKHRDNVEQRPFSICYLIEMAISRLSVIQKRWPMPVSFRYSHRYLALRLANTITTTNLKSLALDYFTVHFATYGAAVLAFPRRDVVHYAGLHYVAKQIEKVVLCRTDPQFFIDVSDPEFQKLAEDERKQRLDVAFINAVQFGVDQEDDAPGIYTQIAQPKVDGADSVRKLFQQKLDQYFKQIDTSIDLDVSDALFSINEDSPNLQPAIEALRTKVNESRHTLNNEVLPTILAKWRATGSWIS